MRVKVRVTTGVRVRSTRMCVARKLASKWGWTEMSGGPALTIGLMIWYVVTRIRTFREDATWLTIRLHVRHGWLV